MSWKLGDRESKTLEFKRAEVTDDDVLKNVVAFLNTDGGHLVVGVDAPDGVALKILGVPQAHERADAIRNKVLTRVEPAPRNSVNVEVTQTDKGVAVIDVVVRRGDETHALRQHQSYAAWTREGDQTRPLNFTELTALIRREGGVGKHAERVEAEARKWTQKRLEDIDTLVSDGCALVVLSRPAPGRQVDDAKWRRVREELMEHLRQEAPFGARHRGWHIGLAPHWEPEKEKGHQDRVFFGRDQPLYRYTRFYKTGAVEAVMRFDGAEPGAGWVGENVQDGVWVTDLRLIEYAASTLAAATWLWGKLGDLGDVYARAAILGDVPFQVRPYVGPGRVPRTPSRMEQPAVETGLMELRATGPNAKDEMARELMTRLLDAVDLAPAVDTFWSHNQLVFSVGQ